MQKSVLFALAAAALPAVVRAATAIGEATPLDIDGIGPIKLGMTVTPNA